VLLYCIILYCTVLYCTVLYCIVLSYPVLHCRTLPLDIKPVAVNNNNNNNNNKFAKHFSEPLIFQLTVTKATETSVSSQYASSFNFIILGLLNRNELSSNY